MREEIAAALFERLQSAALFRTAGRRLLHWTEVAPADQPALFLGTAKETHEPLGRGDEIKRTLRFTVWVYVHGDGAHDAVPSTQLNAILDAFEAALSPQPMVDRDTGTCTLGGLVHDCQIEGEIDTDEGLLGAQGYAQIPIVVIIP